MQITQAHTSTPVPQQIEAITSVGRVETRNSVYLVTLQTVGDRSWVLVSGGILDKPMLASDVKAKPGEPMRVYPASLGDDIITTTAVQRITWTSAS